MAVNRLTGMNTGFGQDIFKSVDEAIRMENRALLESEQDLANEPTEKDVADAAKADKEAKKQEIEDKMERVIDAMHNTQIDSDEAEDLARQFDELQSELAKLELEECDMKIKEEDMKFAEEFCSKCGAKIEEKIEDGDFIIYRSTSEGPLYLADTTATTFDKNKAVRFPTEGEADDALHEYREKVVDPESNMFKVARIKECDKPELKEYDNGSWMKYQNAIEDAMEGARAEMDEDAFEDFCDGVINLVKNYTGEFDQYECDKKIAEAEVKNIKPIKQQGNVFMLEDENGKVIVGEDYNPDEGLVQNAEVYDNKDEADKDYLERCNVVKTECDKNVGECDKKVAECDKKVEECDKVTGKKLSDFAKRK